MKYEIFNPKSYCFGVQNAINMVINIAQKNKGKDIFLLGKVVNNDDVATLLTAFNVKTIDVTPDKYLDSIQDLKKNSIVIFSAHGHDKNLDSILHQKGITTYETTCPKITESLKKVQHYLHHYNHIIFVGVKNHPESIAFLSINNKVSFYDISNDNFDKSFKNGNIIVVTQSTLNEDQIEKANNNIKAIYSNAQFDSLVCDATKIRQNLVKQTPDEYDVIVIVGSHKSSNSTRLYDIAKNYFPNKLVLQIESINELMSNLEILKGHQKAAIYSGTSTPLEIIVETANYLETI
jgi:4-hydroxy-3-methylbut-2-enyl diphosphate reductase